MKKTSLSLLTLLSIFSYAAHAVGPDEYEINYGPGNQKLTLKKSKKYIGIKPRQNIQDKSLNSLLEDEAKRFNPYANLGGFQVAEVKEGKILNEELDKIRAYSTIEAGTHVYYTKKSKTKVPYVPTGDIYLKFKNSASDDECSDILEKNHLQIMEVRGKHEFVVKITKSASNPIKTTKALQELKSVEIAEPDLATPIKSKAFTVPNDPLLPSQWHLQNTGFHRGTSVGLKVGADARVVEAWKTMESLGSEKIIVAVIDDGFDLGHADLKGAKKIVHPWDFTRNTNKPNPAMGDWHGTACAGVAVGNVGGGSIIGAAPNARLMPVRWGPNLSDSQIERWFNYVTDKEADIVSCSWGAAADVFRLSTRQWNAIHNCAINGRKGKGSVVVFAAGNDNHNINDPQGNFHDGFATHPDVISVAASTSRDQKSDYSNYGNEISICAPSSGSGGMGILTADVRGGYTSRGTFNPYGYAPGDYTYDFGGTSSACPLVAGVAALVLSVKSELSGAEVKAHLQKTSRRIGPNSSYNNATGHSIYFGYGCVDANQAVKKLLPVAPEPEPMESSSQSSTEQKGKEGKKEKKRKLSENQNQE